MGVLSIQSRVAYGCVGQSAAALPLQRLGLDVWPVDTVRFSNHPGYGAWTGRVLEAAEIAEIIGGIGARGVFGDCRAVLSGYLGSAETGPVVLDAVAAVRRQNPDALYLCDPVMGDQEEGLYVPRAVTDFYRAHALPAADIITPNAFELGQLSTMPVSSREQAVAAARSLMAGNRPLSIAGNGPRSMAGNGPRSITGNGPRSITGNGPGMVVATSVPGDGESIDTVCVTRDGAWAVSTPRLPLTAKGAGDVFAALFLGHTLNGLNPSRALAAAVSSVFGILRHTAQSQAGELLLTLAQNEINEPKKLFSTRKLG